MTGETIRPSGGGERKTIMNTVSRTIQVSQAGVRSKFLQLGMAATLGLFIVGFAGFAQIDAVHNAGHDYRHSMGFPCH